MCFFKHLNGLKRPEISHFTVVGTGGGGKKTFHVFLFFCFFTPSLMETLEREKYFIANQLLEELMSEHLLLWFILFDSNKENLYCS